MTNERLSVGTEIFFHGDMANANGFGKITRITSDRWGDHLGILMDDGREMNLEPCCFSEEYLGHGGTRFVTKAAYLRFRDLTADRFAASMAANLNAYKGRAE